MDITALLSGAVSVSSSAEDSSQWADGVRSCVVVRALLWKGRVMWAGREVGFQEACDGHLATNKTGEDERRA